MNRKYREERNTRKPSMRNDKIYGVGDDVIDLGPLGKCPYPAGLPDRPIIDGGLPKF